MMFSEYVAMVGRLVHLNITSQIVVAIALILCGAVTQKVVASIQSGVTLTVVSLLAMLFALQLWSGGDLVVLLLATVCIAMVGREVYGRLVR